MHAECVERSIKHEAEPSALLTSRHIPSAYRVVHEGKRVLSVRIRSVLRIRSMFEFWPIPTTLRVASPSLLQMLPMDGGDNPAFNLVVDGWTEEPTRLIHYQ